MRLYRMAAHVFLVSIVVIICYLILSSRTEYISLWSLAYITFFAYCMVTYFIGAHTDSAEGLLICYLTEENYEGFDMTVCPSGLRSDIYRMELREK